MVIADKDEAKLIIDRLPNPCSWGDLAYQFYVRAKVEEGFADIEAGRFITHEDLKKEIDEWLGSSGPIEDEPTCEQP